VKLDHQGKIRCFVAESNAREDDSRKIRLIPFAANEVVVFECGYADYDYFAFLTGQEVWIVTRLKKNAQFKWVKKDESTGKNIESDYEIIISGYSREKRLRKIIVLDPDTGEKIRLLTNNLKWAESRVSAMYKDWWQIELFFKEIKRFYGNSKNEVMTQIWIMFIVYLLFYLLKAQSKNMGMWFSNVISDIKTMLFQRMCLFEWLLNRLPSPKLPKTPLVQQEFVW
jgi:hypothetical protein